jgi:N-acetyl-gamma-glutamyl-phosphate reductase
MIAGIIGAAGYAGAELVRLPANYPQVNSLALAPVGYFDETAGLNALPALF